MLENLLTGFHTGGLGYFQAAAATAAVAAAAASAASATTGAGHHIISDNRYGSTASEYPLSCGREEKSRLGICEQSRVEEQQHSDYSVTPAIVAHALSGINCCAGCFN